MRRILIIGAALGALALLGGSGLPSDLSANVVKFKDYSHFASCIDVDRDEIVIVQVLEYQHSHAITPVPMMPGVYSTIHDP